MFPNQFSSSFENSSKRNAFVQINNNFKGSGYDDDLRMSEFDSIDPRQVPESRDVTVLVHGEESVGVPDLTVIANHPSLAPDQKLSAQECKTESSSTTPRAESMDNTGDFRLVRIKSSYEENNDSNNNFSTCNDTVSFKNVHQESQGSLLESNIPYSSKSGFVVKDVGSMDEDYESVICDYYSRWNIPRCCKLLGGGESSLAAAGTTGWGTPPASTSATSGWNGPQSSQSNNSNPNNNNANQGNSTTQQGNTGNQQWGSGRTQGNVGGNSSNAQQQSGPSSQNQGSNAVNNSSQGSNTNNTSSSSSSTTPSGPGQNSQANTLQNNNSSAQQSSVPQQNGPQSQQNAMNNNGGVTQGSSSNNSWAAAAGKGLPPTSTASSSNSNNNAANNANNANNSTSTKQQIEQLNCMREALYSQDGWGGQNVNQDSNWDIPGSPEPGKEANNSSGAPAPIWKPPVSNAGTDLWEANLRNGGVPSPQTQPTQKAPWGHTPANNLGGTWGEEDEDIDFANMWTGAPPQNNAGANHGHWPNSGGNAANQQQAGWATGGSNVTANKKDEWVSSGWNDPRADPRESIRHNDMRPMIDPREHLRQTSIDHRGITNNSEVLLRPGGGISGRLNGVTSDAMWPGTGPNTHQVPPHHQAKLANQPNQAGVNQWGNNAPPIKDIPSLGKPTGWEEPSPPAQRRNMPNYDDGTSLWGGQQSRPGALAGQQNKVCHWKDMPTPASAMGGRAANLQCPPGRNPNMKPEQPLWPNHPGTRNGWPDPNLDNVSNVAGMGWSDDKSAGGAPPWHGGLDQCVMQVPAWPQGGVGGPKHKQSWESEMDSSWSQHQQAKHANKGGLSKEFIWSTKQFRMLTEMGFKKEDVENALRISGMMMDDALEILSATRTNDMWPQGQRRHSELEQDHGMAYPGQPMMPLFGAGPQSSRQQTQTQPSAQQLRMLVQQIQMAVQAGFLNQQILNQPLAPPTLLLLNQLLQQIKHLQQLLQHNNMIQMQPPINKANSQVLTNSVQITKTRQAITNLQNQIAMQQANYAKQQNQQQNILTQPIDFFKQNLHDPVVSLPATFADMSVKENQIGSTGQQSRLTQWKLPPSLDKESDTEFSRAPGSTAKATPGNSSPNINPLLGQSDSTWSSVGRTNCETGWPETSSEDTSTKDWTTNSQPPAFSDLVPEFEPGKPWKGNPLTNKSIEDDPSLTPGSVVRSPLSLPQIKDTILSSGNANTQGKVSPTISSGLDMSITPLSLSSTTWSFNPQTSTSTNVLSKLNNGNDNKSTWGPDGNGGDLWSGAGAAKPRGPPPGLAGKPPGPSNTVTSAPNTNGWSSIPTTKWSSQQSSVWPPSPWLMLRNLTPQIDGSTLKTLCLQHGPLQKFHLYLNNGLALAKYSTREEAQKAQGALNNCVLGNTTIYAETPTEAEVNMILHHLGGGSAAGNAPVANNSVAWRKEWSTGGGVNVSQAGSGAASSQLWGAATSVAGNVTGGGGGGSIWPDTDQHRNTPSSLNSYLPGDLLGSENL